ncbi:DUF6920 family protein [Haloarchaeobius litoreus]|uniref:DUF6920 family protein n=1 Tax=Haloarchaeobius litoreus TaxID=755306 RepID=A0ABD6DNC3_9EURY|nr:DUF6544 family protein [Haloarchaeobius litoreus]
MTLRKRLGLVTVGGLLLGAAGLVVGRVRTERSTRRRVEDLLAAAERPAAEHGSVGGLTDLPSPVRRYFDAVLAPEQAPPRTARLHQHGSFLLGDEWRPMTATQHVTVDPPGFVWDASIHAAPLVRVRVVDAYEGGEGSLRALALGAVPVASAPSNPEMDRGELLRYLAEGPWLPTALLPSNGVAWESIDERRAKATIVDGSTAASLVFHFDEADLIERVTAERRYRQEDDDFLPWTGHFGEYEWHDGVRIPTEARVEWETPSGPSPYWRARVTAVEYDVADRSRHGVPDA